MPVFRFEVNVDVIFILKITTTLLGLTLPGYLLARLLCLQHARFAAFPLSALMIYQAVTALTLLNGKITLFAVSTILVGITALCGLALFNGKSPEITAAAANGDEQAPVWWKPALTATALMLFATALRATLYPLGGFDTFTRWDALAREMLQYGSLSFYPPVTATDFSIYPLPDGFPPLVASVYWWIYAATGKIMPQLTAISVVLQLLSILGLCWSAAATAFGKRAASFTLLVLVASPLLTRSVLIGQESGFLALAVAGQICFALAAIRTPSLRPVVAAALFASIGAVAREYGPAVALPGFFLLICAPATRRLAWKYALIAALLAAPWYIRNWLVTGSPLYPTFLPGTSSTNPLLTSLVSYYGEIFGIANFESKVWFEIGFELILGGSFALLVGFSYLVVNCRRLLPHTISVLLMVTLWLWSIGKTSGGAIYSMRVLAPAIVVLTLIAGKALAAMPEKGWLKHGASLLVPAVIWGILSVLSFPQSPSQLPTALLTTKGDAPEFCEANKKFAAMINTLAIPAGGILTDSPFLAVILKRETRFTPAIIWSRETSTLLAAKRDVRETESALVKLGIDYIAINRSSLHNDFLLRLPLYKEIGNDWNPMVVQGDWALFALSGERTIKGSNNNPSDVQ